MMELQRQNAKSCVTAAKNELTKEGISIIAEWLGNESKKILGEHFDKSVVEFNAGQYEDSARLAQESVAVYRKFHSEALKLKQKFENREIIADALVAALTDLYYDAPDVNYEPTEGVENVMLGEITIFAKSKGKTGDMRLGIDFDGNIRLEVANSTA